ncbi:MAG: DUF1294 domain-containing protein [Clostridia bacterium]|nr:DUF1294 domain-containing protein [Clostridia bacterium]MDD4375743.1 DUF1294 domain-containing protein [Clostridia bacterium]
MLYFITYYVFINLIGFLLMCYDKKKSIKREYRISEKTLFMIALFLGGLGIYYGMYNFRHKTKNLHFTILIPIIIIINILTIYFILSKNVLNIL